MNRELAQALDRLRDEQYTISPKTLRALSDLTRPELLDLQSVWGQISITRRQALLAGLIAYAQEHIEVSYHVFLRWLLEDNDPLIREMAISGLWEDDDDTLVQLLAPMLLEDPASDVRASAADALGRFVLLGELGDASPEAEALAIDTLLTSLDRSSEVIAVRRLVVEAIAYASEPDVRPIVSGAYTSPDRTMRASAVRAMGNTGDHYWWPQVQDELDSPEPAMRAQAAYAAGEIEVADAIPQLLGLVDDPDEDVRFAAVRALGRIGGPKARQALLKLAKTGDQALSEVAREALSELEFAGVDDLMTLLAESAGHDGDIADQPLTATELEALLDDDLDGDEDEYWDSEEAWDAEDWDTNTGDDESFDDEGNFDNETTWQH
jgi:HEAT repeat protein